MALLALAAALGTFSYAVVAQQNENHARCVSGNEIRQALRDATHEDITFARSIPRLLGASEPHYFDAYIHQQVQQSRHRINAFFQDRDCG